MCNWVASLGSPIRQFELALEDFDEDWMTTLAKSSGLIIRSKARADGFLESDKPRGWTDPWKFTPPLPVVRAVAHALKELKTLESFSIGHHVTLEVVSADTGKWWNDTFLYYTYCALYERTKTGKGKKDQVELQEWSPMSFEHSESQKGLCATVDRTWRMNVARQMLRNLHKI